MTTETATRQVRFHFAGAAGWHVTYEVRPESALAGFPMTDPDVEAAPGWVLVGRSKGFESLPEADAWARTNRWTL